MFKIALVQINSSVGDLEGNAKKIIAYVKEARKRKVDLVIFPELARAHARKGANILVNLTNDAWFGMTSAPYQHLSMAVLRSVENRLPTVRAANTGFSAFITPWGEILGQSDLFTEAVLRRPVDTSGSGLTFYARYGL